MATLKLKKTIRKEVLRQVAKKIKLEERLKPKIKKLLLKINKEVAGFYEEMGGLVDFNQYKEELVAMLKEHYSITQKQFKGAFQVKSEEVDLLMADFIEAQASKQSDFIIKTTRKETLLSLAGALALLAGGSRKEVANEFRKNMDEEVSGRAEIISTTETQQIAEKTKMVEALAGAGVAVGSRKEVLKTWHTVGDISVRASHSGANGQTKKLEQPFEVGSSRLMYPSDTSLGAEMIEIYNCRCVSLTQVS